MKRLLAAIPLLFLSMLYVQQAVAQKESHREYAGMKIPECNSCHKGEGVAPNHGADWNRNHRLVAQKGSTNCKQCHDQAYCLDCHTGGGIDPQLSTQQYRRDYVPKSHRSDWREIHPIKALDNPQSCLRCHDQKNCRECHSKFRPTDLQFQSHRRQFRDIKLRDIGPNHSIFNVTQCPTCHPGGMLPSHAWSGDHAIEARRNLQSCQTCHSDGDVCMTCHSARSGLKVNPHPREWGKIKGNFRDKSSGRTCIRCHDKF